MTDNHLHDSSPLILAIDQGTSSTKTILLDQNATVIARASEPLQTYYRGVEVEQDPEEIFQNVLGAIEKCLENYQTDGGELARIKACGISNQRETFVLWDKTGKTLYNAIVWQCKRSVEVCSDLRKKGLGIKLKERTGLIIDPYFSGSKVIWLYENDATVKQAIDRGEAYFGTIDTWLLYKLTNGKSYMTDYTNASRTMFFNLYDLAWDQELIGDFGLSGLNLPQPTPSATSFGSTNLGGILDREISISAMIGDSHAAAFGEACFEAGSAKATIGTGCSILMNVGEHPQTSEYGMLSTICWSMEGRLDYALEGIIVSAGSTIEWVKNQLGLFDQIEEIESICHSLEDNGGVYLIPAFSGLGAPHWKMNRKASIEGLSFSSTKEHIIRAAVESIAYQIKDVIVSMESDAGTPLSELKIDGGISTNKFIIQFLADLLDRKVSNIALSDVSALGAGYLAGLDCGIYENLQQIKSFHQESSITNGGKDKSKVKASYESWKQILE